MLTTVFINLKFLLMLNLRLKCTYTVRSNKLLILGKFCDKIQL